MAGFIGNGHFMRDILYAADKVKKLKVVSICRGRFTMNKISQDYLIRPMGIFQFVDCVGIDVCCLIMSVMKPYMKSETIRSPMLDSCTMDVNGGQYAEWSEKDGILKYEKGKTSPL